MFLRDLMRGRRRFAVAPEHAEVLRLRARIGELAIEADAARGCPRGTTIGEVDEILNVEGRDANVLARVALLAAEWVRDDCPCALRDFPDYRLFKLTGIER